MRICCVNNCHATEYSTVPPGPMTGVPTACPPPSIVVVAVTTELLISTTRNFTSCAAVRHVKATLALFVLQIVGTPGFVSTTDPLLVSTPAVLTVPHAIPVFPKFHTNNARVE